MITYQPKLRVRNAKSITLIKMTLDPQKEEVSINLH